MSRPMRRSPLNHADFGCTERAALKSAVSLRNVVAVCCMIYQVSSCGNPFVPVFFLFAEEICASE